ncbi:MAG: hypothetical protein ACR2PL_03210 [Dehalococcoidia bacterium]
MLKPETGDAIQGDSLGGLPTADDRMVAVASVVARRAAQLLQEGGYASGAACNLAGGRLLLYAPDDSLGDAAAAVASDGFFDPDNQPPWGTWLWYARDEERVRENDHRLREAEASRQESWLPLHYATYLVSWVPPDRLDVAKAGIRANPEGCIGWASEILARSDDELLQSIAAIGRRASGTVP